MVRVVCNLFNYIWLILYFFWLKGVRVIYSVGVDSLVMLFLLEFVFLLMILVDVYYDVDFF